MKRICFFIFLMVTSLTCLSQDWPDPSVIEFDGHYSTLEKDSLNGKFWIFYQNGNLQFWHSMFQVVAHDSNDKPCVLYPSAIKNIVFQYLNSTIYLEPYEYEKGQFCFIRCLKKGTLSLYRVPDFFDYSKSLLQSNPRVSQDSDIELKVGTPNVASHLAIKIKGKYFMNCGRSLFKCRRKLARYLEDYPDFIKLLDVKRRDWKFTSNSDVINTFNQLYGDKTD